MGVPGPLRAMARGRGGFFRKGGAAEPPHPSESTPPSRDVHPNRTWIPVKGGRDLRDFGSSASPIQGLFLCHPTSTRDSLGFRQRGEEILRGGGSEAPPTSQKNPPLPLQESLGRGPKKMGGEPLASARGASRGQRVGVRSE